MERFLLFCKVSALVFMIPLTISDKLSLRSGQEDTDKLTNCTMCPRIYKPVCASNGKWYHSSCFMACEVGNDTSINILYEGECSPEHMRPHPEDPNLPPKECVESCPKDNMPMCGANGKWYLNMCFLDCDRVAIGAIQLCPPTSHMPSMPLVPTPSTPLVHDPILAQFEKPLNDNCPTCTKVYDPVCLSNGRWYFNTCVMECVLGERQYQYAILYHGKCISF